MDPLKTFEGFIEKKGLKKTVERSKILEVITGIPGHFDAEALLKSISRRNLKVSRASAYRTIKLLVEAGIIRESIMRDGRTIYEYGPAKTHHDHMVCIKCGALIEFSDALIEKHQQEICRKHKFTMTGHRLEISGICGSCR